MCRTNAGARRAFTLVELAVVIVIIGVLAAFGVPQLLKSAERAKAAEAFNYLATVRAAQERYLAKEGVYATNIADLDIVQTAPRHFDNPTAMDKGFPTITGGTPHWQLTLTRRGGSSGYGGYTVTFTETGYNNATTAGTLGAYPEINPMGSNAKD